MNPAKTIGPGGTVACDLLVIGGGINGAGIARDAAGRGLNVVLCEQDDLGAHTSSASSKLIHGGLRYLQYGEFRLVRKALREREVLMRSAPHLIQPLRFVMPHGPDLRPAWMIRSGLFLYDHLARRELLPASGAIDLTLHGAGTALQPQWRRGYIYADAAVDDARLVIANAIDAAERGAIILPRTRCTGMAAQDGAWRATLQSTDGRHGAMAVSARCVVNAAGAWTVDVLRQAAIDGGRSLRLVKGSHIVVPRLFDHDDAYILQNNDGRIVFAIPYQQAYTLVGTTDVDYGGDPRQVAIDGREISYLCDVVNRYFRTRIAAHDVVWTYAGVRPLLDNGAASAQAATRDYDLVTSAEQAPMLSVFGGKITTFRTLAEDALDRIATMIAVPGHAWTAQACLPGGDILAGTPSNHAVRGFPGFIGRQQLRYPWLPPSLLHRYARAYGSRLHQLLDGCRAMRDLGAELVPALYEQEAHYLVRHEWARRADDILWRRSKLGLHVPGAAVHTLDTWLQAHQRTARTGT